MPVDKASSGIANLCFIRCVFFKNSPLLTPGLAHRLPSAKHAKSSRHRAFRNPFSSPFWKPLVQTKPHPSGTRPSDKWFRFEQCRQWRGLALSFSHNEAGRAPSQVFEMVVARPKFASDWNQPTRLVCTEVVWEKSKLFGRSFRVFEPERRDERSACGFAGVVMKRSCFEHWCAVQEHVLRLRLESRNSSPQS